MKKLALILILLSPMPALAQIECQQYPDGRVICQSLNNRVPPLTNSQPPQGPYGYRGQVLPLELTQPPQGPCGAYDCFSGQPYGQ